MKDAQKPDHISLGTLIGNLKQGRFVIPDFQREFEWNPQDIRDLMRSIFLDYYIGSLLLWKGKPRTSRRSGVRADLWLRGQRHEPRAHRPRRPATPHRDVLRLRRAGRSRAESGQPVPLLHTRAAVHGGGLRRGLPLRLDQGRTQSPSKQEAQFASHMFPLSVVGSGGWDLPNWVQGYEAHWRTKGYSCTGRRR